MREWNMAVRHCSAARVVQVLLLSGIQLFPDVPRHLIMGL